MKRIQDCPELTKTVNLILISGDYRDDIARGRGPGVSSYLTKPVRRAELRMAISTAMASGSFAEVRAAAPAGASAGAPENRAELHILLAEDNAVNQRVAQRVLEKAGHTVAIAGNGRVALAMLAEQFFDLILMDVQMPEMDGFEATSLIRQNGRGTARHIPIIAMTAHAMAGDRDRCIEAGMDSYISKPVATSNLLDLVAQHADENQRRVAGRI